MPCRERARALAENTFFHSPTAAELYTSLNQMSKRILNRMTHTSTHAPIHPPTHTNTHIHRVIFSILKSQLSEWPFMKHPLGLSAKFYKQCDPHTVVQRTRDCCVYILDTISSLSHKTRDLRGSDNGPTEPFVSHFLAIFSSSLSSRAGPQRQSPLLPVLKDRTPLSQIEQ